MFPLGLKFCHQMHQSQRRRYKQSTNDLKVVFYIEAALNIKNWCLSKKNIWI
jgi:hypothetical protein